MFTELDNDDWRNAFAVGGEPEPVWNGWVSTKVFGMEDVAAIIAVHTSAEELEIATGHAAVISHYGVFYLRDGRYAFVALDCLDTEFRSHLIQSFKRVAGELQELIRFGLTPLQRRILGFSE